MMTFNEWLKTDNGKNCAKWPVDGPDYLRNRLWWAFEAGAQEGLLAAKEKAAHETEVKP
jgi:hypothetical protein